MEQLYDKKKEEAFMVIMGGVLVGLFCVIAGAATLLTGVHAVMLVLPGIGLLLCVSRIIYGIVLMSQNKTNYMHDLKVKLSTLEISHKQDNKDDKKEILYLQNAITDRNKMITDLRKEIEVYTSTYASKFEAISKLLQE